MAEQKKNLPIAKMRSGGISIAIFKNKIKSEKGDFEVESLQLQKSWKKQGSNDWDSSSISLRKSDLIKLRVVLDKAIDELFLNKDDKESEE